MVSAMQCRLIMAPLMVLVLVCHLVEAYPEGAPESTCQSMIPLHTRDGTSTPLGYTLVADKTSIESGQTVKVTVGGVAWRGIILQGRSGNTIVGAWETYPAGIKLIRCSNAMNTLTHTNDGQRGTMSFTWRAPSNFQGTIVFKATMVWDYSNYEILQTDAVNVVAPGTNNNVPAPAPVPVPAPGPLPNPQTPNNGGESESAEGGESSMSNGESSESLEEESPAPAPAPAPVAAPAPVPARLSGWVRRK